MFTAFSRAPSRPPRRRTPRATPAFAVLCAILPVLLVADAVTGSAPARGETAACWQPADLARRPGEEQITKNVTDAFVPLPHGALSPRVALPAHLRGALRRVDLPKGVRRIALTFDLCEQPYEIAGYQGDIVDFLRDRGVAATFFAGGKWLLTHQDRATQLMASPRFEVANHAWEHRNFRLLDGARLGAEIDGTRLAYAHLHRSLARRQCAVPGRPGPAYQTVAPDQALFRFPFGACNQQALDAVNDRGVIAVQWDVSAGDPWRRLTAERMVAHVVSRTRPGSILIFHANGRGWQTGKALPLIVDALARKGYEFVTVGELLATPGAQPVFTPTCYDAQPGDSDRYDDLARRLEVKYGEFYKHVGGRAP